MRAYVVREPFGPESLRVEERPVPEPGAGQVLVKMRAVALNYRDLMIVNARWKPSGPRVPVSDGVGEVVAVGEGVTRVAAGARVAGAFFPHWLEGEPTPEGLRGALGGTGANGVMAEYVVLDAEGVAVVPEHLGDEEAATLPCAGVTAWHAVVARGGVGPGDTLLVQGTGGVSLFAAQFALQRGATVIATSGSEEKLERMRALGVTHGINYREHPDWDTRVLALTNGRGVDHVVDPVGGENLNRSLNAVRLGGTVSLVGFLAGMSARVETFLMAEKNVRLQGILVGSRAMFEEMCAAISTHRMQPVVGRIYRFDELASALRRLEDGQAFGKICIRM